MEKRKKKKFFGKKERQFLINAFFICGFMSFSLLLLIRTFLPDKSSQDIATTISGILGTSLGFFGSVLVYKALKAQIDANRMIQEQFKNQNDDQLFFRLVDNLQNRIINNKITSDYALSFEKNSEGYNTLTAIVRNFRDGMELNLTKLGRIFLARIPESIEQLHYDKIDELNSQTQNRKENYKIKLIEEEDINERWEYLKIIFNSETDASRDQNKILTSIGRVYFYKTNINLRKNFYEDLYDKIYRKNTVFLDGYLKNLDYILTFISNSNYNKDFYIDFLNNNLTSHEKGIIFYYLALTDVFPSFKKNKLVFILLENLHLNKDLFVDSPSEEEYKKELSCFINDFENN